MGEQQFRIWVNGDEFELSEETGRRAEALQNALYDLIKLMHQWRQARLEPSPPGMSRPPPSDMRRVLLSLDHCWAGFEQQYISELIDIDLQARRQMVPEDVQMTLLFLELAFKQERCLQHLEAQGHEEDTLETDSGYHEARKTLVQCIAMLNSRVNQGRDDFTVGVLTDAYAALRK